jgi:starch synthase
MRICFLSSELHPFAKTGGLGDAVSGLARHLWRQGHDLRVFLPYYGRIGLRPDIVPVDFLQDLQITFGPHRLQAAVYVARIEDAPASVYLIRCPALFDRHELYDNRGDEHLRFAGFTHGVIEVCQRMGFAPEIFHCHDWHTALLPIYLRTHFRWDQLFARSRSLLSIHNLAYQGVFAASATEDLGLTSFRDLLHQQELRSGRFNFMTTGILYADWLSTVSETYAREIRTTEYGFGLDPLLRSRADHLVGITNGVDYNDWNPTTDSRLAQRYDAHTVEEGKAANKRALLEELGIPSSDDVLVLGIVSRLTAQKGFDLLTGPLRELLSHHDVRLVCLGTGESRYEDFFYELERHFPSRVAFCATFDNDLAHRIQAGADVMLMPSLYEPCGLSQLYSLRYGTVPVVRRTGGLADTVSLYDADRDAGTGFVFDSANADGVRWALKYLLATYGRRDAWWRLVRRGMAEDWSWDRRGKHYERLYEYVMGH